MDIHFDQLVEPASDLITISHDKRNENEVIHSPHANSTVSDFPCEDFSPSAQSSHITEKFILDFLSLPDVTRPIEIKEEPTNHGPKQCPGGLSDQLSMTWDPDRLTNVLSVVGDLDISIDSKQSQAESSNTFKADEGAQEDESVNTCSYKNRLDGGDLFKSGGSELRSRRRREFHKIHTRRSRAKLNEKMDLLKRVLPKPPSGVVVKSKAQIIDYAISVLGQLSFSHAHSDGICPGKV